MFSFVGNIIGNNGAKFLADFFAVIFGAIGHTIKNTILNTFYAVINFISGIIWHVCQFVLGVLDVLQLAFTRFLGLNLSEGTSLSLGDYVEGMKEITVSGGSNYYDFIMTIFRAIFGVAIILMIVFTIVAMIMQEYKLATTGYQKADNNKGKFVKTILSNILTIFLIPLIFYTIIIGTNSILTSFYRALGGFSDTTIAGNVLAASTYDANRYRAYANGNKRIPITISVYSMDNAFGKPKSNSELEKEIQDTEVQAKLKAIAGAFVEDSFLPFERSTIYNNGNWENYKNYSMTYNNTVYDDLGQYFENFICTREQYYVLADFVDFCQLYDIKYYIKSLSEDDICWKYVDDVKFSQDPNPDGTMNGGDLTIDVTYRDAEKVNNPSEIVEYATAAGTSSTPEYKTLSLTTKLDMTSPIADALKTASTLLGIDNNNSSFNVMERDESGDYVNLVQWANRKVKLKLSTGFSLDTPSTWTFADQIIVYEYYRFQNDFGSTNNTLEDYTLQEIKDKGVYLDAQEMTYRHYNSNTETYEDEEKQYCVKINNSYYRIKESKFDFDDYGHAYFELDAVDANVGYFEDHRITIKLQANKELELSDTFNINDRTTWSFTDQVLIYEYFKDLSLSNGIRRSYKFSDFNYDDEDNDPKFNVYEISNINDKNNAEPVSSKFYLYINGTYYQCDSSGDLLNNSSVFKSGTNTNFLIDAKSAGVRWFGYSHSLSTATKKKYGLEVLETTSIYTDAPTRNDFLKDSIGLLNTDYELIDDKNALFQKYSKMNMKLSQDFSFYNTETWTFRDYVIMYLYINYFSNDPSITVESLRLEGIVGSIVITKDTNKDYYLKVPYADGTETPPSNKNKELYINLNLFDNISEQKFTSSISSTQFDDLNLGSSALEFVEQYGESDLLLTQIVSSKLFEVSENFDAYDPRTWTVGDYLLMYLIEAGKIDSTIGILKVNGYSSLCYTAIVGTDIQNFYRFGKQGNSYFLNETKINKMGYSVDKWFSTNLMSFLLAERYGGLGVADVHIDGKDFAGGTIANPDSYLYNIDLDVSSIYNLQNVLAKDFLTSNVIITDISKVQYTYSNSKLVENDISTWKYLDTIIYVLTGQLPTKENPFLSFLYNDGSATYLKVGGKYVQISGTEATACLQQTDGTILTNQIFSNNRNTFGGVNEFNEYYNARLKGMIYSSTTVASGTNLSKFYYYSRDRHTSNLSSSDTGFVQNKLMSDLDFILAKNNIDVSSTGLYQFNAKMVSGEVYVEIKTNVWMKITSNDSALIHYKENSLSVDHNTSANAFTGKTEYTAFNNSSGEIEFNKYDAIIYSVYGQATVSPNTKFYHYTCGLDSKNYLYVNGSIILFESTTDVINKTDSVEDQEINFLYDNFYNKYISTIQPTAKSQYDLASVTLHITGVSLSCATVDDYHGLAVIAKYFGITNLNQFDLIDARDGSFYLKFDTGSGTRFINLKELANVSVVRDVSGTNIYFVLHSESKEVFKWQYALMDSTNLSAISFKSATRLQSNNIIAGKTYVKDINTTVDDTSDRNNVKGTGVTLSGISTYIDWVKSWTWLGLLSSYIDPSDTYIINKYYHNGKIYYHFRNAGTNYLVPVSHSVAGGSIEITSALVPASGESFTVGNITVTPSTNLDAMINNLGLAVIGGKTFGSKLTAVKTFYIASKTVGATTTYHAIYGLVDPNGALTSTGATYVKYNSSTSSFDDSANASEASTFMFTSKPLSQLKDWSILDLIVEHVTGSIYKTTISGKVLKYEGKYYMQYEGKFILLPKFSGTTLGEMFSGSSDPYVVNEILPDSTLNSLLTYNGYGTPATNESCVYDGSALPAALSIQISNFENNVLKNTTEIPYQRINFSEKFDPSNYSTWTYSDYVMYYAFSNGFYGSTDATQEVALPFTYVPSFSKSGEIFYNITYLDVLLAFMCGGPAPDYNYLSSSQAKYDFYLVYNSSNEFYLRYTHGSNSYYIPLSGDIYIDFSKMEIHSNTLGLNLTNTAIQEKADEFTNITSGPTKYYKDKNLSVTDYPTYKTVFKNYNFQTFVNSNSAPAYVYYLINQDPNTGSTKAVKVIRFAFEATSKDYGTYFNYNKFFEFYDKFLVNHLSTTVDNKLEVQVGFNEAEVSGNMKISLVYDKIYPDLVFDNYYYYSLNAKVLSESHIMEVPSDVQARIKSGNLSGSAIQTLYINFRLSSAFSWDGTQKRMSIANPKDWTILDYIIVYERSRENVRHNIFKSMTLKELATTDYYYRVYCINSDGDLDIDANDDIYLYINNNFYSLKGRVELASDVFIGTNSSFKLSATSLWAEPGDKLVSEGNINGYDFKVLAESYELSVNPLYIGSASYNRDKNNISYVIGDTTHFKYLDTNIADTNYRINVSLFGKYSVTPIIKKASWVEKLMTDMQVYYPDLNWEILIATDGWLDALGEFTSAHINGLFTGGQNSSNTTAAGLVLAEFFMSVATEVEGGFGEYEYSSVFDKETIRALMMSLMGEENYQALAFEAEVFMDYFNSCFAPIIDDFARGFGENINENSLRLNAYKSYLATLLLSSDIGEYLYTIATRVFAEYTIGEYLAGAAGDYLGYYNYVNYLTDDDGNPIEAYNYGSFTDLIYYENQYCGGTNPVFTFNFKKAFDKYKNAYGYVGLFKYEDCLADEGVFKITARILFEKIDEDYKEIYRDGYDVGESGKIIDSNGEEVEGVSETHIYCYMLHVYWEIRNEVNILNQPSYLTCYRNYLEGNLSRWNIIKGENIQTADQYFEGYKSDKAKLQVYRMTTILNAAKLFFPRINLKEDENESLLDTLKNLIDFNALDNISLPIASAWEMLEHDPDLKKDVQFVLGHTVTMYFTMGFSEETSFAISDLFKDILDEILPGDQSTEGCWNKILNYQKALDNIIDEIKSIRDLIPGQKTERGSDRLIGATSTYYADVQLDGIINAFSSVKNNIDQYVAIQTRLDQAQKKSVTFTLAQYGANYVTTGYEFSVRNKSYTFKPETDPLRLAEYVYGGAFLEKVGEGSKYTSPEFTGMVKASKIYDNVDNVLKTHLDTWSELRGFLSKIADQTAELYFTTNLADLDISKINAVKISDTVAITTPSGGSYTSIKEALYHYMIAGIDVNIVGRITNCLHADGTPNTTEISDFTNNGSEKFEALAQYVLSGEIKEDQLDNMTLEEFKRLAMKKVMDNEQNQDETPEERSAKYMMVFNMLGIQVDLSTTITGVGALELGRVMNNSRVHRPADGTNIQYIHDDPNNKTSITGVFRISNNTLETVKVLSGLENRPTREILTREYAGIRPGDYYDEAFGDTFIACTYKDGLYYPILGSASRSVTSPGYLGYHTDGILKKEFISSYYDNNPNIVVMKGIITADGLPTAIRKYNNPIEILKKQLIGSKTETYNAVTYYRTNVGANFGPGEDLVNASKIVGRVTTKNYTKYISGTAFSDGIGSATTFTGRTNLRTTVSSDYSGNFVQSRAEYLMSQADDYGAISVLDDFSYFYLFGAHTITLLLLAFVTLIPVLINAVGGAASRILDIIVLFLASPIVISTNSLYTEGKNPTYQAWKKNMQTVTFSAFGYIIAFSGFSLLIPMIYNVKTFINIQTYNKIAGIGGLSGIVTFTMVNSLARYLWVITAVAMIEKLPKLLLPIITANRGDIDSPHPGLGKGAGKKFTDKASEVIKVTKEGMGKIRSVVSGRALMGMMEQAKDTALNMIPGYSIAEAAKQKLIDPKIEAMHQKKAEVAGQAVEAAARYYGLDPKLSKALGKSAEAAVDANRQAKKQEKARMQKNKEEFQNLFK